MCVRAKMGKRKLQAQFYVQQQRSPSKNEESFFIWLNLKQILLLFRSIDQVFFISLDVYFFC